MTYHHRVTLLSGRRSAGLLLGWVGWLGVLLCVCLLAQHSAMAAPPDAVAADEVAADMGTSSDEDADASMGEELLLFELDDMSTVISATRRPEKISWLSLPVSIISAEDIHYSGLTTIPDML